MAFGTGTHETTKLCLRAIDENFEGNQSFLDVGTGTGILAMAAAKMQSKILNSKINVDNEQIKMKSLTSKVILGCDTDENSVQIARENAELNGVADNIEFSTGSIDKSTPQFDFVAANLTADVIVPILPLLIEKAEKVLILSGILREQQAFVESELRKFSNSEFKIETLGEWISITVKNA
jgi:ribosomal protein L11 methyltransferase